MRRTELGGALVLPREVLCEAEAGCMIADGNLPLYADEHYLSREGAAKLYGLIEPFYQP